MTRRGKFRSPNLWLVLLVGLLLFASAGSALAKKALPDHPIDLNAATAKELEELPGIGPTTANAIIDFRVKSGRIRRVEDLLAIHGVSEAKLKKLRPYVTLGAPAIPPTAAKKPVTHTASNSTPPRVTITPKPTAAPPPR